MRFIQVKDRAQQALDRLTKKLLKDFPEQEGRHGVVFGQAPAVDLHSKRFGWPPEDTRPDFVKEDEKDWIKLK